MREQLPEYIKGEIVRLAKYQTVEEIAVQIKKRTEIVKFKDKKNASQIKYEDSYYPEDNDTVLESIEPTESSQPLLQLRARVIDFIRDKTFVAKSTEFEEPPLISDITTEIMKPMPNESPNQLRRRKKSMLGSLVLLGAGVGVGVMVIHDWSKGYYDKDGYTLTRNNGEFTIEDDKISNFLTNRTKQTERSLGEYQEIHAFDQNGKKITITAAKINMGNKNPKLKQTRAGEYEVKDTKKVIILSEKNGQLVLVNHQSSSSKEDTVITLKLDKKTIAAHCPVASVEESIKILKNQGYETVGIAGTGAIVNPKSIYQKGTNLDFIKTNPSGETVAPAGYQFTRFKDGKVYETILDPNLQSVRVLRDVGSYTTSDGINHYLNLSKLDQGPGRSKESFEAKKIAIEKLKLDKTVISINLTAWNVDEKVNQLTSFNINQRVPRLAYVYENKSGKLQGIMKTDRVGFLELRKLARAKFDPDSYVVGYDGDNYAGILYLKNFSDIDFEYVNAAIKIENLTRKINMYDTGAAMCLFRESNNPPLNIIPEKYTSLKNEAFKASQAANVRKNGAEKIASGDFQGILDGIKKLFRYSK